MFIKHINWVEIPVSAFVWYLLKWMDYAVESALLDLECTHVVPISSLGLQGIGVKR